MIKPFSILVKKIKYRGAINVPNKNVFKAGDKVECINIDMQLHLTIGKLYDVIAYDGIKVSIANDKDTVGWYLKSRFKKV